jgi:hypothetical protein
MKHDSLVHFYEVNFKLCLKLRSGLSCFQVTVHKRGACVCEEGQTSIHVRVQTMGDKAMVQ